MLRICCRLSLFKSGVPPLTEAASLPTWSPPAHVTTTPCTCMPPSCHSLDFLWQRRSAQLFPKNHDRFFWVGHIGLVGRFVAAGRPASLGHLLRRRSLRLPRLRSKLGQMLPTLKLQRLWTGCLQVKTKFDIHEIIVFPLARIARQVG
jgi:hypothetical protein